MGKVAFADERVMIYNFIRLDARMSLHSHTFFHLRTYAYDICAILRKFCSFIYAINSSANIIP